MRLHQAWTIAAAAAWFLSGAAFADVTVSHSNDPTSLLSSQFATLFGAEHKAADALPAERLQQMVVGPKAAAAKKVLSNTKTGAQLQQPVLIQYSTAGWALSPSPPAMSNGNACALRSTSRRGARASKASSLWPKLS